MADAASFKINHFGYQVENELFWIKFREGWEEQSLRIWCALTITGANRPRNINWAHLWPCRVSEGR